VARRNSAGPARCEHSAEARKIVDTGKVDGLLANTPTSQLQAARLAARFNLTPPHARTVARLAYEERP